MNQLVMTDPRFFIGDNNHPFCESGFVGVSRRVSCLVDTGFTLGFAFSKKSIDLFRFTDGYLLSMLLGNGLPTKGIAFVVELLMQQADQQVSLGKTSVVFMDKQGEPLIGVETLTLWSPVMLDWKEKSMQMNTVRN